MASKNKTPSTKSKSSSNKKKNSSLTSTIKKTTNKQVKKMKKSVGGKILLTLGTIVVFCLAIVYFFVPMSFLKGRTCNEYVNEKIATQAITEIEPRTFEGVKYDDFQINFLELGDWHTGDCVYIKAGDNDILIDAGSKYASAPAIINFVDKYCTDKKLEYVIATHAHEDHIAGFSGGTSKNGVLYHYDVGTIIEFAKTDKSTKVLDYYNLAKEHAISKGAKVYNALEVYNDPLLREISLGDGMKLTTLYQKYYETKASSENDYSVCNLLTYKEHNFLFTGDLESGGEKSLVESNSLPHCELFKAGHHGSKTSSSSKLLEVIQPEVVCVCCCAGSNEYTSKDLNKFPTQEFINRVAKYTSNIYVTSISLDDNAKTFASMNGDICFSSNGKDYSVSCTNNNLILRETEWFKKNRNWPTEL